MSSSRLKIMDRASAARWRAMQQGSVVFTNGVFDLLHPGHIEYLEAARQMGDALLVGVNTDASARRLAKGPDRPIVPEQDRIRVLAAVGAVDLVVPFDEDTPFQLISEVRPDILTKGGDYAIDQIVGADLVRSYGGKVTVIPFIPGYSTTRLVDRLRAE